MRIPQDTMHGPSYIEKCIILGPLHNTFAVPRVRAAIYTSSTQSHSQSVHAALIYYSPHNSPRNTNLNLLIGLQKSLNVAIFISQH